MLELDKDRFAQLLREAPEKDALFPEPQYSPYIQSLIDRLKEEESLDPVSYTHLTLPTNSRV